MPIYDYECNQGNHNLTQFGTVTVSDPLSLTNNDIMHMLRVIYLIVNLKR